MKKLLYVIIAIMLVTTSCQKDTNNTSTTGNGTNSVTKKNTIGTFATSSAAVNFAATPFPSYGQSGDYFNVTALRNSDCHYSNVSGNYLLCYFDHLDNGLTGNANKGGAEVTHQFTFTNFTGSQGHGIRMTGIIDMPYNTPAGNPNAGGWIMQTHAVFKNPTAGYPTIYKPLVIVYMGTNGINCGIYNNYVYNTTTHDFDAPGNITQNIQLAPTTFDMRSHSALIDVFVYFDNTTTGTYGGKVDATAKVGPLGTRDFTVSGIYTYHGIFTGQTYPSNSYFNASSGVSIQRTAGLYSAHEGTSYGSAGINQIQDWWW